MVAVGSALCCRLGRAPHWHPPIQAMNETVNPEPVAPRAIAGGITTLIGALSWILCWRIGAQIAREPTSIAAVSRQLADALRHPAGCSASARHAWSSA